MVTHIFFTNGFSYIDLIAFLSNDLHSSLTYLVQPFHSFYIWKEYLKQNMYTYYCVCMFIHKRNCREHAERINWDTTVPPSPTPSPKQTKWWQCCRWYLKSNSLLIVKNLNFWQGGPSVPSSARLREVLKTDVFSKTDEPWFLLHEL